MKPFLADEPEIATPERQRAWLASLLMRSPQSWFGRFALQFRRLAALRRGQRLRLQRKAAMTLAGAALALSLGVGMVAPPAAHAEATANITVANGAVVVANDGQCSLPEAILNANGDNRVYTSSGECAAGSGFDNINLPSNGTFTLATAYGNYAGSDTGLPQITSSINIFGNNSTITRSTAGATPDFRIFAVSSTGHLGIFETTISNGRSQADGGGIVSEGELTVQNSHVINNHAAGMGGGLAANGGSLTVGDGEVSGNDADTGGGIGASGIDVTILGADIHNNTAAVSGGGLQATLTDLNVSSATVNDNDATGSGAGLYLSGSEAHIQSSTISGNDTNGSGGGISNTASGNDYQTAVFGQLSIEFSTISGNSAGSGGGLSNFDGNDARVYSSTISGNSAAKGGGAWNIFGDMTIVNSTISDNEASGSGGGLLNESGHDYYFGASMTVILSTITGNTAGHKGGGITSYDAVNSLAGNLISGNTATDGGSEFYRYDYYGYGSIYSIYNVMGTSSDTTAQAVVAFTPSSSDKMLTSDSATPTALADILDANLTDNGGQSAYTPHTFTHALAAASPAIDFVPNAFCNNVATFTNLTVDQRGEPRRVDIPGVGNDGVNIACDSGSFELQETVASGSFCPVGDAAVGYLRTDVLGVGQGTPTKGVKTRKLVVPNASEVDSLYGQLAGVDQGKMKFVRFLPQGSPRIQINAPTSPAYQPGAMNWWGTDLPAGSKSVKGQFFWGKSGNKSPRAFVLWPTYETAGQYANVFETFDDSATNFVSQQPGFTPTQTQTVAIPQVQDDGATVNVAVAVVPTNGDGRPVVLTVAAGDVSEQRVITGPNQGKLLNLEQFALANVDAGVDEVSVTLESPNGGDSAAMLGAAVNYECSEPSPIAAEASPDLATLTNLWPRLMATLQQLRAPHAPRGSSSW